MEHEVSQGGGGGRQTGGRDNGKKNTQIFDFFNLLFETFRLFSNLNFPIISEVLKPLGNLCNKKRKKDQRQQSNEEKQNNKRKAGQNNHRTIRNGFSATSKMSVCVGSLVMALNHNRMTQSQRSAFLHSNIQAATVALSTHQILIFRMPNSYSCARAEPGL